MEERQSPLIPVPERSQPEVMLWPIAIAMAIISIIMTTGTHNRSFQTRAAAKEKQAQIEEALFRSEEVVEAPSQVQTH